MDERLKLAIDGPIARVTLNKPDRFNVLGEPGDGAAFSAVVDAINADSAVRCVILTGAGRAFSAGGDLTAMRDKTGLFAGDGPTIRNAYRRDVHEIVRALDRLEPPAIAAVNGAAAGLGMDVACLADMRLAGASARFGVTFLKVGLAPGDGGAWLLPRLIGMARASELLFTGKMIDAETAADWGLVNRVVPDEELLQAAEDLAGEVAEQPPHVLRFTKMMLRRGREASYADTMEMAAALQALAHQSEDHAEAVAAFFDKRRGDFTGR